MKRSGLYLAIALVIIVNGVVLANVQINRSGNTDAAVELTERELRLSHSDKENSGISLQLNWQHFPEEALEWFDKKKLEDVGFDCGKPVDAPDAELYYAKALPRKAYVVIELSGPAWEAWTAREKIRLETMAADVASGKATHKGYEEAQKRFSWYQSAGARLFVVDVGKDPEMLRKAYSDRNRYIITPALVRLRYCGTCDGRDGAAKPRKLAGSIEKVLTDTIYVPRDKAGRLPSLQLTGGRYGYASYFGGQEQEELKPPRYTILVSYGKHYEPWVVAVKDLEQK